MRPTARSGRPPIQRLILADEQPIRSRPADGLAPELPKAREELGSLAYSEEDVVSYALYPQVAKEFFLRRGRGETLDKGVVAAISATMGSSMFPVLRSTLAAPPTVQVPSPWRMAGRAELQEGWVGPR